MSATCAYCAAPTDHVCRVCDSCSDAVTAGERAAQGLPVHIEDPSALHTVAVLAEQRHAEPAA